MKPLIALVIASALGACGAAPQRLPSDTPKITPIAPASVDPQAAFMAALRKHCGRAYAGKIIINTPAEPDDPFANSALVMHVRECAENSVKIPFHVGNDHSRTWVISRSKAGLRLKHDHRHADGSLDMLTQYGGDTVELGAPTRQTFPVDAFSISLFEQQDRSISTTNVWAIEIVPGEYYRYELSRPNGRLFRVEFDLRRPVLNPPTPWGHPALPGDAAATD